MHLKLLFSILIVLSLSACRAGAGGDKHSSYPHDIPEIISFDIVDSYLTNSDFEPGPYAVSPYIDDGLFELFWHVESFHPYRVELYLNDRSYPDFGVLMSSAWCGFGESCGNESYQYCRYRDNLSMICELPESFSTYADRDISSLFTEIPEDLYFVLEVCDIDLFYCEYQSLAVSLE